MYELINHKSRLFCNIFFLSCNIYIRRETIVWQPHYYGKIHCQPISDSFINQSSSVLKDFQGPFTMPDLLFLHLVSISLKIRSLPILCPIHIVAWCYNLFGLFVKYLLRKINKVSPLLFLSLSLFQPDTNLCIFDRHGSQSTQPDILVYAYLSSFYSSFVL